MTFTCDCAVGEGRRYGGIRLRVRVARPIKKERQRGVIEGGRQYESHCGPVALQVAHCDPSVNGGRQGGVD